MNEAELLFTQVLKCDRVFLYSHSQEPLSKDCSSRIAAALKKRIQSMPIQYILKKTEFMGLEFMVDESVLIPRPETEVLVEAVLEYSANKKLDKSGLRILDIGTGCGNIAVSLAKMLNTCDITALDISGEALKTATRNARLNAVAKRVHFLKSDFRLRQGIAFRERYFDIIVANPPYIPTGQIGELMPELKYEPGIALDGGIDGLACFRSIINNFCPYLQRQGRLFFEIGFGQLEQLQNIFQKDENFEIIEVIKDYSGIDRVIVAKRIH